MMESFANRTLIGIGEMVIAADPAAVLCVPHLGSCLGITVYDSKRKCGAAIHCLLPSSKSDLHKAQEKPYLYVDTGFASMLNQLLNAGSKMSDLIICVAGGSSINDKNNVFEIGKKNFTVLKKLLWKNNLLLKAEHVGGDRPRSITLVLATGEVVVTTNGENITLFK